VTTAARWQALGRSRVDWPLFSADSHVVEPPDLWQSRVPASMRDRAPRVVEFEDTELWVVDSDTRLAVVGIQAQAGERFAAAGQRISKRAFYRDFPDLRPDSFVKDLERDGVAGAVLFPSSAHQAYRAVSGPLLDLVANHYNDWILEFAATHPERLRGIAMLNCDDVVSAVVELERVVRLGAAGALIPIVPLVGRRYDQAAYTPLWEAAESLGVPLLMHVGANQAVLGREPMIDLVRHATKDLHVQASLASMVLSGVFHRHPKLRVGAIEFGASWMAYLMQQVDRVYTRGPAERRVLPEGDLPSDHLRRGVFLSFQADRAAIGWRGVIGLENLLWGNDYPHAESTFPRSREILAEDLAGVPREEAKRITRDNTCATFGFQAITYSSA
jgi:predicted TIM-barrel fold metal-dependent hydrolase